MNPSLTLTLLLAAGLLVHVALKLWLNARQVRHVAAHRELVPAAYARTITLADHQKAADYTLAKGRFGLWQIAFSTAVLLGWTLLGGLDALNSSLLDTVLPRWGAMAYQLALLSAFVLIGGLIVVALLFAPGGKKHLSAGPGPVQG
jgi:STE24 endopeptidase